jgi:predicted nucleic acid-binding protein
MLGPSNSNYHKAEEIVNKIKSGEVKGVVTHLVLLEILNALRRIFGREYNNIQYLDPIKRQEYVKNESYKVYQQIVSTLLAEPEIEFKLTNGIDSGNLFSLSLNILNDYFGEVRVNYSQCKLCRLREDYSYYKGLGPMDVSHALLSHELGCTYFYTMDKDFNRIKARKEIDPTKIMVF